MITAQEVRRIYNRIIARPDMPEFIARHRVTWELMRMVVRGLLLPSELKPEHVNDMRVLESA